MGSFYKTETLFWYHFSCHNITIIGYLYRKPLYIWDIYYKNGIKNVINRWLLITRFYSSMACKDLKNKGFRNNWYFRTAQNVIFGYKKKFFSFLSIFVSVYGGLIPSILTAKLLLNCLILRSNNTLLTDTVWAVSFQNTMPSPAKKNELCPKWPFFELFWRGGSESCRKIKKPQISYKIKVL